jgi:hypothetical protein
VPYSLDSGKEKEGQKEEEKEEGADLLMANVLNSRTTTSQKCEAVSRRTRT